mmetsp:Transcript_48987/g.91824  ORF Transcript_48987/g.91824 Transcript_48987/m.91824 type:complete len:81 (+) Transcript_48987:61-303(+)
MTAVECVDEDYGFGETLVTVATFILGYMLFQAVHQLLFRRSKVEALHRSPGNPRHRLLVCHPNSEFTGAGANDTRGVDTR